MKLKVVLCCLISASVVAMESQFNQEVGVKFRRDRFELQRPVTPEEPCLPSCDSVYDYDQNGNVIYDRTDEVYRQKLREYKAACQVYREQQDIYNVVREQYLEALKMHILNMHLYPHNEIKK